jgi:hypothetical protein
MSTTADQLYAEDLPRTPDLRGGDTRNAREIDRENDTSQLLASSASHETEPFLGDGGNSSAGTQFRRTSDLGSVEQNAEISEERDGDRIANNAIYVSQTYVSRASSLTA